MHEQKCREDCQTSPPCLPQVVLDQEQFAGASLDFPARGMHFVPSLGEAKQGG